MTMFDIDNPVMVRPMSPEAGWKHGLLIHFGELFHLRTLVETGTYVGATLEAVQGSFDDLWSIELSPTLHESAKERLSGFPNVHLVLGSSGETLPSVINQTKGPLLFWLDAHFSGGECASNGDQTVMELDAIKALRPDSLVLIDDVVVDDAGRYLGQDARITVPDGWQDRFLHGVLVLHSGGYKIP